MSMSFMMFHFHFVNFLSFFGVVPSCVRREAIRLCRITTRGGGIYFWRRHIKYNPLYYRLVRECHGVERLLRFSESHIFYRRFVSTYGLWDVDTRDGSMRLLQLRLGDEIYPPVRFSGARRLRL